jgi:hypothetical protein
MKTAISFLIAACSATALAQPTINSLGTGVPLSVTNSQAGTVYIGGANGGTVRWTLSGSSLTVLNTGGTGGGGFMSMDGQFQAGQLLNTGPQIFGNTATAVTPLYNQNVTLVPSTTQPAATEFGAGRWSASTSTWTKTGGMPINRPLLCFGSGSSGQSTGSFMSANFMSSNGRFMGGLAYISTYNNAGNAVSANSFRWRPWIWDADANAGAGQVILLPTPNRTSSNTALFRTGNVYDISADGTVILGAQEHSSGGTTADSANHCVWRWNSTTNQYDFTLLSQGGISSTPGSLVMNDAGTIIVGRAFDGTNTFIGRWNWNPGTSSWDAPVNIISGLTTPASWLPGSVTSCGLPPNLGGQIAMSEDASVIVGSAIYSTCGSFMTGGFISRNVSGEYITEDWYDYNAARNVPGVSVGGFFGPTGDNGNPARGLPVIGNPTAVSPDGTIFVGFQGGTQRIVGAPPWILQDAGGPSCIAPSISTQPAATTNFSACTNSIILSTLASGTPGFTYQWYKDGAPLTDGGTGTGSTITGATSFQLRINPPLSPADAGTYYAVATGQCGTPAQTTNAVVQLDPAFATPATNDTCSTARVVSMGTNVLTTAQSVCNAYDNGSFGFGCLANTKADLWYSFTPASSGNYRFETCGSNIDTVMALYDNCFGAELACNDNYVTGPTTGCTNTRSRLLSVALNAGQTYLIRIGTSNNTFLSATSTVNLSITNAPLPAANDGCQTATPAVLGPNAFDLNEATNDWTASCNTALSRDVWFSYQPTASGRIRFSTCGITLNTVLSAYDQCFGNELACNDNFGVAPCSQQSQFELDVTPANPVVLRVGTSSATTIGTGNLTISTVGCDSIDFNNDGLFPDDNDLIAFLTVLAGGDCPGGGTCSDIDFNNDGLFPDDNDLVAFLTVLAGGNC